MKRGLFLALGLTTLAPACSSSDPAAPPTAPPGTPPAVTPGETPPTRPAALPPPVSGGTLVVARDGTTAVAADPDRDQVYVVDLAGRRLLRTTKLRAGDEPGRLAEDGDRRVHVALRGAGALATIALDSGEIVDRRAVCAAPRGVAFDGAKGLVHVACATGELVSLPAAGGAATRRLQLDADLRDVIVQGDHLLVSRLRHAELLELDGAGAVLRRQTPPDFSAVGFDVMGQPRMVRTVPSVAWRAVGLPTGGAALVHSRALADAIPSQPGAYGGGPCKGGIVNSTVSVLDGTSRAPAPAIMQIALPVDLALSRDGARFAVVDGSRAAGVLPGPAVVSGTLGTLSGECGFPGGFTPSGQPTAVAFDGQGRVIVQSREPARLDISDGTAVQATVELSPDSRRDAGHELFHGATRAAVACATCHPEGGEDGHVWTFASSGARRTQSLRGGILSRAPFHWSGDLPDLQSLSNEVMTKRMVGPTLGADQVSALGRWLDGQPELPAPPRDAAAAERGRALFNDAQVGCATCHSGPALTNNQLVDVGTGDRFKVPSLLGVAYRAPYLHAGCAKTLRDRFGACGGDERHGKTSQLSAQQLDDLTTYVGSL